MDKLTFKTVKSTGKYRSFQDPIHMIKWNKKQVGNIYVNHPGDGTEYYDITLMIYKDDRHTDNNPNCVWKHIRLLRHHDSLKAAQDWLKVNIDSVVKVNGLKLYKQED
jgi:hypothetical protein